MLKLRAQSPCFCSQKSKELQKTSSAHVGVTQSTNFHGDFFCTLCASHRAQTSIKLDHDRCQSFIQCLNRLTKLYGLPNLSSNVVRTHPMHSHIRHVMYLPEQSSQHQHHCRPLIINLFDSDHAKVFLSSLYNSHIINLKLHTS